MANHIMHTPVVEAVAGPRDIGQAVFTARVPSGVVNYNSSSVFLNHYRTLRTGQRRGSKTSGFRTQCAIELSLSPPQSSNVPCCSNSHCNKHSNLDVLLLY
ncbi:unnamed protein product [Laminaria digitata]